MHLLLLYLAVMNLASFLWMRSDKAKARRGERRIPEKRLFAAAAAGGALGVWLGMRTFRHKTKHASFTVGIPLLILLNVAAAGYIAALIR